MVSVVEQQITESPGQPRVIRTGVFVAAALLVVAVGIRAAVPRPPDVRGLTGQQAIQELHDAGYRVNYFEVVEEGDHIECYAPSEAAVVIGQRPCPDLFSSVPEGSIVLLWIKVPASECVPPPGAVCVD
jgi:beta-lactam-binding protein with PASTA domain